MKRLASYGTPSITIDNRPREERVKLLEAEVAALRAEVRRLRATECPICRLTHELEGAVR